MSPSREAPEDKVETSDVGGLGEIIPDPLLPVWRRVERVQSFREAHGNTYVTALEALTAVALAVGYVWWVYLYFYGGAVSL
ncbi:hypothetical protein [Halogeometricum luteum]|uniref:Uncharacterized protein n=1 Tax=Halogeometricum luteum TaxID=2950537 RepID=A0ABU2G424_9EURY|nr:hypothetical protein [Halogeometricum sp. S3BR5-2]MDS0295546.1 hypothetical protein [Halogeometricum sp. S3BR5-2]